MILVRANYTNMQYGITETTEYLERFFRNLLMGEQNELKSRYMIVGAKWEENKNDDSTATQLAKVIGITPDGIKKQLEKLKKENRIKHVGPTKGGHWEIIK